MIDKIFICHYEKLSERKKILLNHLDNQNIYDYEFITDYNKDTWSKDKIKEDFPKIFETIELEARVGWKMFGNSRSVSSVTLLPDKSGKKLRDPQISLALKHLKIIQEVSEKYEYALVLEDDVVLCDDFLKKFSNSFNQLPDDWDLGWVGTCCEIHAFPILDGKLVYKNSGSRCSRCTHAYIISNQCAKKILPEVKYCNHAIDFWFNIVIEKYKLNNYWFEPVLAIQNSQLESSLEYNI